MNDGTLYSCLLWQSGTPSISTGAFQYLSSGTRCWLVHLESIIFCSQESHHTHTKTSIPLRYFAQVSRSSLNLVALGWEMRNLPSAKLVITTVILLCVMFVSAADPKPVAVQPLLPPAVNNLGPFLRNLDRDPEIKYF